MPKLLGEFLQEQQEPFVLEFYLLERGYRAKRTARFLQIKRRDAIPKCAEFVSAVFKGFMLHNGKKIKNKPRNGNGANDEDEDEEEEEEEFTSASATTFYSSCSESEVEGEAECTTKQSDSSHEAKQLSPISVLEETESEEEASQLHQRKYNFKKTKGESSKSISQRKPMHHQANKSVPKFEECMDYYDHEYSINKRALQQKRLLVDCVREVIENERRRDDERGRQLKRILGAEELWKVVCENVWLWSQESIREKNIHHLVKCDFMASLQGLNSASHQEKDEVFMEIGDAILEDIINEIVTN